MGGCCCCVKSTSATTTVTPNPLKDSWDVSTNAPAHPSLYEAQISNFNGTRVHTYNGAADCDGPTLSTHTSGYSFSQNGQNQLNVPLKQITERELSYSNAGELQQIGSYAVVKYVSSGSFSVVYCVRCTSRNKQFALKQVSYNSLENLDFAVNEITCTKKLQHSPYIPGLEEIQQYESNTPDSSFLAIVQEYIANGTLKEYCDNEAQPLIYDFPKLQMITTQLQTAQVQCHNSNVVHRDIKPENVLVQKSEAVNSTHQDTFFQFCDFGISAILPYSTRNRTNITALPYLQPIEGTSLFRSPEIQQQVRGIDLYAADVWSLGVTLAYVAFGKFPVTSIANGVLVTLPSQREYSVDSESLPNVNMFIQLLQRMLQIDPTHRPTAEVQLQACQSLDPSNPDQSKIPQQMNIHNITSNNSTNSTHHHSTNTSMQQQGPNLCGTARPAALRSPVAVQSDVTTQEHWLQQVKQIQRYKNRARYAHISKVHANPDSRQSFFHSHVDSTEDNNPNNNIPGANLNTHTAPLHANNPNNRHPRTSSRLSHVLSR